MLMKSQIKSKISTLESKKGSNFLKKFKNALIIISLIICIEYIIFLLFQNLLQLNFEDMYVNDKIVNYETCKIKSFNIWSKNTLNYVNQKMNLEKCIKNYTNVYYNLRNGVLSLKKKISWKKRKIFCFYKCYYPVNDKTMKNGHIYRLTKPVTLDCDVFSFFCNEGNKKKFFKDVSFHIRKDPKIENNSFEFLNPKYKIKKDVKQYDLHIYVVDSLSYYHALRGLTQTRKFLLNKLNAIEFKYLNCQGENSRPNAYGFLMNKQRYNITDIFGDKPQIINDFHPNDSCQTPLDHTTFIIDYYREMGYLTMNVEDFSNSGAFNYYGCIGLRNNSFHHNFRPFQILKESNEFRNLIKQQINDKCYQQGFFVIDYLEKFLKKKSNKPKISLLWHTYFMHDDIDSVFDNDKKLRDLYRRNIKIFNNSFTILLGDHGYRMSSYLSTDVGEFEQKNPYFAISLPYELRKKTQLVNNLKTNSENHISHLDIYATLLDILTEAGNNNFENLEPYDLSNVVKDKIKGKSLLRRLPNEKRSCYDMYIPIQYCMCELNFQPLPKLCVKEREILKKAFVYEVNKKIKIGNLTEICAIMTLDEDEPFDVQKAVNKNGTILYQVEAVTSPGKAMYRALFTENITLVENDIIRLNKYKHQAEVCEKSSEYRQFCYCKSLL